MENPATTDDSADQTTIDDNRPTPSAKDGRETTIINANSAFFAREYEMYDDDGNQLN